MHQNVSCEKGLRKNQILYTDSEKINNSLLQTKTKDNNKAKIAKQNNKVLARKTSLPLPVVVIVSSIVVFLASVDVIVVVIFATLNKNKLDRFAADPIINFFPFFTVKLGHLISNEDFLHAVNMQA